MKRILVIVLSALLLITASVAGYFYFQNQKQSKFIGTATLDVVPANSSMILVINDFMELSKKLADEENAMIQSASSIPVLANYQAYANQLVQLSNAHPQLTSLLKKRELVFTFENIGSKKTGVLLLMPIKHISEITALELAIKKRYDEENGTWRERRFNSVRVHDFTPFSAKKEASISFSVIKGTFVISSTRVMIENTILQSEAPSIRSDEVFKKLEKTANKQSDINIYFKNNEAVDILKRSINSKANDKLKTLSQFATWSEIDINIKDQDIIFGGYALAPHDEKKIIQCFKNQSPERYTFDEVLPATTSAFSAVIFSNKKQFQEEYNNWLEKSGQYYKREDGIRKLDNKINSHPLELVNLVVNNELVKAYIPTQGNTTEEDEPILALRVLSSSVAEQHFSRMVKDYISDQLLPEKEWIKTYKFDDQTSATIYKMPDQDFFRTLFPSHLSTIKSQWFTTIDNYLIFTKDYGTITEIIRSNMTGEVLKASEEFKEFKDDYSLRCNSISYSTASFANQMLPKVFTPDIIGNIKENHELQKFNSNGIQFENTNGMIYFSGGVHYNPNQKTKPKTIWQARLDNPIDFKPIFVTNHNDKKFKEILIQDKNNTLYLINNAGRIVWQIPIAGKIIEQVQQVDLYKNEKLQYLFNTKDKLYAVDRNGNNVNGFPVTFRSKASNCVSIFDYDKTRNYRFFVACENKKIYAYNKSGKILPGWNQYETEQVVHHPLQHHRVEGKDYIICHDQMKDYILHRRGTLRVKTNLAYEHSQNNTLQFQARTKDRAPHLATTDQHGLVHLLYFDGTYETINIGNYGQNHYFVYCDIDGKDGSDFVMADKNVLLVKDITKKKIFQRKFNGDISHTPSRYKFSWKDIELGVVISKENEIHLINNNGDDHKGFPLTGSARFSVGHISKESKDFNLLVGSPDGYLYNYSVQ